MSNIVEITKSIHLKKKEFCKGLPGQESLRYIEYYKGNKEYYKGNKGEEQLIKVEEKVKKTHRKNYKYYTGFKGQERLVKIKCFNDIIKYYEGSKNEEYLIKEEFPNGYTKLYENINGDIKLSKIIHPDGKLEYFIEDFSIISDIHQNTIIITGDKMNSSISITNNKEKNIHNVIKREKTVLDSNIFKKYSSKEEYFY